ncbi:MAG: histone deacetylase family protein [bacterium]
MKIYFSPLCLSYGYPGHPESPERIRVVHEYLKRKDYSFVEPQPCSKEDVLRVHSEEMVSSVKAGTFFDWDTPVLPNIYDLALLSAGSAIQSLDSALNGETAFSLMRPPGHHAMKQRVMGFCYFNNIAVAAAKYLEENLEKRIAILDIDCHHGNGTEDIFLGNESVLYVSIHQSPLYPGTGLESKQNALNFLLPPGTGEEEYLKTMQIACEKIEEYNPSILCISVGFDTFAEDPLTHLNLKIASYGKIGKTIAGMKKPTFIVMEGGYSPKLPECVHAFVRGLDG